MITIVVVAGDVAVIVVALMLIMSINNIITSIRVMGSLALTMAETNNRLQG